MNAAILNVTHGLKGFYTLRKGKVDESGKPLAGTETTVAEFPNLIVDNGLDRINAAPGGVLCQICLVGTGNTPPTFTDTTMASYLATNNVVMSDTFAFIDGVNAYWRWIRVYRFNAGTATGNLAEVGTGWATNDLFSRALITDGLGVPTTITVLPDEYLDVTYELRNYINKADQVGIMSISGIPYDLTYRPAQIGVVPNISRSLVNPFGNPRLDTWETQTLGTVYTSPGGSAQFTEAVFGSYTPGSYFNDVTFSFALGNGNFATGIGSAMITTTQCRFQMNFTPKIPKDATKILSLTYRVSWARYP